jgi:hypothetical protein
MKIFISYPHSSAGSKKLVANLAEKLKGHGITAWTGLAPEQEASPVRSLSQIASDMVSCDKFLLVIDSAQPKTEAQDFEWRSSLEAVWSDSKKRLIPILIGDVEMPNFIRSAVPAGQPVEAIRIDDPRRDWSQVADKLVSVLEERSDLSTVAQNFSSTEEDRAQQNERLAYVKSTAQAFKATASPLKNTM